MTLDKAQEKIDSLCKVYNLRKITCKQFTRHERYYAQADPTYQYKICFYGHINENTLAHEFTHFISQDRYDEKKNKWIYHTKDFWSKLKQVKEVLNGA